MNKELTIKIYSIFLASLALLGLLAPFLASRPELFDLKLLFNSLIILVAAWCLYKHKKVSIVLLAISAFLYLGGGLYFLYTLNLKLSALIPAFYFSFIVRLSFAIFAAYLLVCGTSTSFRKSS